MLLTTIETTNYEEIYSRCILFPLEYTSYQRLACDIHKTNDKLSIL